MTLIHACVHINYSVCVGTASGNDINPCVLVGAVSWNAGNLPEMLQLSEGDGTGECARPTASL